METINLGRVVGLSAFETAVRDGFTGTESEWLESLQGPQGPIGMPGTTDFNELDNVPSTFPSTIPQVQNLETELSSIREAILQGSGSGCDCPTFPINLNQIDWQAEAITGHVRYIGGNIGINFGRTWTEANPNAAGEHHCNIQMRSQASSLLIRASGIRDTLNRAFFFRPNEMNGPTPDDMILFNDGRLNARVYSQDGVLLDDLYMPIQGHQLEVNSIHNDALPTAYPMGLSFYSVNSNQLGNFPFPSLMIMTERFADGRTRQTASRITGQTYMRFGADNLWTGGGSGSWIAQPTFSMIEKLCEKLDIDINEIVS